MTNEELKKKIVEILEKGYTPVEYDDGDWGQTYFPTNEDVADALIAAGIGDVSKLKNHRVIAEYSLVPDDDNPYIIPNVPLRVTQLYSGEEVEKMAKERKELKDELRSKVEYIQEQDEVIKEYKHRAQVAENELKLYKLAVKIWQERYSDIRCFNFNIALKQAEKELAEGRKDD